MEEETTKLGKLIYNFIDAMFWLADETYRWWEISKITIQVKLFRRQKSALNKQIKENEINGMGVTVAQTAELASLNESISKLASKEDFIRSKCWSWTPVVDFSLILLLFLYGVFYVSPVQNVIERQKTSIGVFRGQITRVRELPFQEQSIVSDSIWFNNKLYIAGNNGVSEIDSVSGGLKNLEGLPKDFFAKKMQKIDKHLLIAGYSGIFKYEENTISPIIAGDKLGNNLINSFAVVNEKNGQFMIGTIGNGIYRINGGNLVPVPQTNDYIVKSFGHQKKELWILHDEGILRGKINKLESLDLQVLAGKKPRCMITTDKNIYIGTDKGVVVGIRDSKSWVWTMISTTKPGYINDMVNAGEILFIASNEGVFRYYKGKMDRLSSIPTYSLCLCDTFLAATGNSSVLLYYFDFTGNLGNTSIFGVVPELGTYTPSLPVTTLPMSSRPVYKRMPDYGLLDTDGKSALAESNVSDEKFSPDRKPMVELPIELQKPVFSDISKFNSKYYLATTNRGIWSFDGKTWTEVNHNGKGNARKLCSNTQHCYAYSEESGIYEILDNIANLVVNSNETAGLKYLSICDDDTLLLLYSDGKVKAFSNGELKSLFTISNESFSLCHSVWKVSEQYVAVFDQGVMTQESNGQWNLMLYQGNIDSAKVADVSTLENRVLYIALNDGRIFEYSRGKLLLSGIVPDHPISIKRSDNLWISSADSLYLKENNSFVSIPFKSSDKILGAFTDKENKNILVFTASGLRILTK